MLDAPIASAVRYTGWRPPGLDVNAEPRSPKEAELEPLSPARACGELWVSESQRDAARQARDQREHEALLARLRNQKLMREINVINIACRVWATQQRFQLCGLCLREWRHVVLMRPKEDTGMALALRKAQQEIFQLREVNEQLRVTNQTVAEHAALLQRRVRVRRLVGDLCNPVDDTIRAGMHPPP